MSNLMDKQTSFRTSEYTWSKFKLICTINGISVSSKLNELIKSYVKDNIDTLYKELESKLNGEEAVA
jgi:hypothetical protein